mmetsp:Transcript_18353/g.58532  ORF Transcript_18353/g.58532 Transcript_18353/m.58532 type:complete len:203 (-) Transcript_18353:704-1312(-)
MEPDSVFQNRMHRSAVPPPEASRPDWCGDHAIAFTAAQCSPKRQRGSERRLASQTSNLLSLPPEASCRPSGDQRRPHTSCRCALRMSVVALRCRTSFTRMVLSRLPVASWWSCHASEPTRDVCSLSVLILRPATASHSCTCPLLRPTARYDPRCDQATDVTRPCPIWSHSCVTLVVWALQRYTHSPSATASTFWDDQSSRLR